MKSIPFSPPDVGEEEIKEIINVIKSGWITTGPKTKQFEREIAQYCHTEKAVCLNSATACLESILRLLGIGTGDEVITTAYTYTATVSPICHVGATPVLVDIQDNNCEMNYEKLEKAITDKTKAIIPVDLGGIICDYEKIFNIVQRQKSKFHPMNKIQKAINHVVVIADAAHAFGAKKKIKEQWRMCGEIADFTSFSFHAVKNLTTAEGGALTWRNICGINNDWLYQQFMLLSLHGQSKDALAKTQLGAWEYDIVFPAYKCNMTDIAASMGLVQLKRYGKMLKRRKEIIIRYNEMCDRLGVSYLSHYTENSQSSGHLYVIRIPGISHEQRCNIIQNMAKYGIACNVHYKPLPMMTAYKNLGWNIEDFPNAYKYYENEITLPLHTRLSDIDIDYVCRIFQQCVSEYI